MHNQLGSIKGEGLLTADVAASFAVQVAGGVTDIELTASGGSVSSTATALVCPIRQPGRIVRIVNADSANTITLTATAVATATEGQIVLDNASNLALAPGGGCTLRQRTNGSWVRV